jgi:phosphatidylglycerol:prolipoprotein diacylglycerol transferase
MLEYIIWNPNPDAVSFGSFAIKWYGLSWTASIFGTFLMAYWFCKQEGKDAEKMTDLIIYVFIGALIGARLVHALVYQPEYYFANPLEILKPWKGGLASHGGIVGAFVALWFFKKQNPAFSYLWIMDRTAIASIIAGIFIRLGNLMNSELIGKVTDVSWAFIFIQVDESPRHPSVLYEAVFYTLVFVAMVLLYLRLRNNLPGIYLSIFLIVIFTARLLIEFTKVPDGEGFLGLSSTQTLHIPLILSGFVLLYFSLTGKLKKYG